MNPAPGPALSAAAQFITAIVPLLALPIAALWILAIEVRTRGGMARTIAILRAPALISVCAWCPKPAVPAPYPRRSRLTHGICADCMALYFAQSPGIVVTESKPWWERAELQPGSYRDDTGKAEA